MEDLTRRIVVLDVVVAAFPVFVAALVAVRFRVDHLAQTQS